MRPRMLLGGLAVVAAVVVAAVVAAAVVVAAVVAAAVVVAAVSGEKEDGLDGYPVLHRRIIKNNYKINENYINSICYNHIHIHIHIQQFVVTLFTK